MHKDKRTSKKARRGRAEVRAIQTASFHYDMDPEGVEDCTKQIKTSKSGFVLRWGKLGIHRILSPFGVCFAAYDASIKMIAFFIPKERGLQIAKGAKSSAWGKKRSGVMLLPPLRKKAPPRVNEDASASVELDLVDGDEPLSTIEVATLKAGLKRRIDFLQTQVDKEMKDDPQKNWASITTMGQRIEELEKQLESMPEGVYTPVSDALDKDELRRRAALEDLALIEEQLLVCPLRELVEKSERLSQLKSELFSLIPDSGIVDRREALHNATVTLQAEIEAFQKNRSYGAGVDRAADRRTSAGLRARMRTLSAMHRALFGSSAFRPFVPDTEPEAANSEPEPAPAPTGELTYTGNKAIDSRWRFVCAEIDALQAKVTGNGSQADRDLFYQKVIYLRERATFPGPLDIADLSDDEAERTMLIRRILSRRGFAFWFERTHDTKDASNAARLNRFNDELNRYIKEYEDRYPGHHTEIHGPQQTQSLSGAGN